MALRIDATTRPQFAAARRWSSLPADQWSVRSTTYVGSSQLAAIMPLIYVVALANCRPLHTQRCLVLAAVQVGAVQSNVLSSGRHQCFDIDSFVVICHTLMSATDTDITPAPHVPPRTITTDPHYLNVTISSATAEIVRVGSYYFVQDRSRSLILILIESPHATSY